MRMKHAPLLLLLAACDLAPRAPVEGPPWFQLDDAAPEDDALTGYVLRAGRVGADPVVRIELPPEAFAAGPFRIGTGDVVVFGHNDGAQSLVETVDVDTGAHRALVGSSEVLRSALVDADSLYVHVLEQATRRDLGVRRFRLGDGVLALDDGELVLPGLAPEVEGEELFGPTFATQLALDEGSLVVQSCSEILCRARVLDLASGDVVVRDEIGQGELLGAVDGTLVVYEAGNGWPCRVLAIDAQTGAALDAAFAYGAAVAPDGDGRATLVWESGDEPGLLLARALDDDGPPRTLAVFEDDALHPVPNASRALAGLALPNGFVALGGDGRLVDVADFEPHAFLIRVDDGALFETARSAR